METFVARQPILDGNKALYAYELLFRSGPENFFPSVDPDVASARVITSSTSVFGPHSLTVGRKAFVNVTRNLLTGDLLSILPNDWVVIELLETIEPDDEVLAACKMLKKSGYLLALDDFVEQAGYEPLIDLADFLKVDFLTTKPERRRELAERYGGRVHLIAEKVETLEDVREGLELGYEYFQGFYFCQPEVVARREIPGFKLNYLRFIEEISRPELDFGRLAQVVEQEVSLSVKLLRFLNLAAFGFSGRVNSVRDALVLLGERALRKWATMIALCDIGEDKPRELIVTSLVRAGMCERLAPGCKLNTHRDDLFLVGMLSLMDTLVGRPMTELVEETAVSAKIRAGLVEDDSLLGRVRSLVVAHERANWGQVATLAADLGVSESVIPDLYTQAVDWAREVFQQ